MTTPFKNYYIIGPLGAGKSSVGYQIARVLELPFFDSDREIEKKSGVDIDWLFTIEGEEGYRSREQAVIEELTTHQGVVIATGGGAIETASCRSRMANTGTVIYLKVHFDEQLSRVKRFPLRRPVLKTDTEQRLRKLNEKRERLYESIADLTYDNYTKNPVELAQKIVNDIQQRFA